MFFFFALQNVYTFIYFFFESTVNNGEWMFGSHVNGTHVCPIHIVVLCYYILYAFPVEPHLQCRRGDGQYRRKRIINIMSIRECQTIRLSGPKSTKKTF